METVERKNFVKRRACAIYRTGDEEKVRSVLSHIRASVRMVYCQVMMSLFLMMKEAKNVVEDSSKSMRNVVGLISEEFDGN